jgi:hypothetical protein
MKIEIEVQDKGISIEEAKIITETLLIINDLPSCKIKVEVDGNAISFASLAFGKPKFYPEPNYSNTTPIQS